MPNKMWLLKRLWVLVVSIYMVTADVSLQNAETDTVPDLLSEDTEQVVEGSATQSAERPDVSQPLESNSIQVDESNDNDLSSKESLPVTDKHYVQKAITESFTNNEASQGEDTPLVEEDVILIDEVSPPKQSDDASSEQGNIQQETEIEVAVEETELGEDPIQSNGMNASETGEGDVSETPVPDSEFVEKADAQNTVTIETIVTANSDDTDPILDTSDQTMETTENWQDDVNTPSVDDPSAKQEAREDSEHLHSDTGREELSATASGQMIDALQVEAMDDTESDSSADDGTPTPDVSSEASVLADENSDTSESEVRYQPNCGVWGVYQPDSRYANISILALLFQDLFQKDEAEATAILNDLASSVTMPMQDVLDKIQNVSEEISEMAESADRIKRSPNSEFVEGLDDIDKFFEGVDVPDEMDVGAVGSSIQEVLMGQGTQIVIKRLTMGFAAIKDGIMTMKVSAVESIEDIISRREEFAVKRDVFLGRLRNGKTVLVKSFVEFREADNERRKELLQQFVRFSGRVTLRTANALKEFAEHLFEDGEDIQDILKESTAVDDEIQQMLRKLS